MKFKFLVAVTALLTAAITWAHHGTADYDLTKAVHLSGTISQTEWANPHVLLHLSVTNADRKVTEWIVECPPPNWMNRSGLAQSVLQVGTELDIEGYPAKDGSSRFRSENFTVSQKDGKFTVHGPLGWK